MFSKLMPKEAKFFDLFNAHGDLIVKGGRRLVALVDDLGKGPEARHRLGSTCLDKARDCINSLYADTAAVGGILGLSKR